MVFSNRVAVLMMGFWVGALLAFGRISAESYLLANFEPIHAIYIATVSSVSFSILLPRMKVEEIKFSRFAGASTIVFAVVLFVLFFVGDLVWVKALTWYFLIIFSTAFHRWVCGELIIRHLNPAIVQSYFAYQGTAFEVGTLLALAGLKLLPDHFGTGPTVVVLVVGYLILSAFFYFHFVPAKNLEVRFERPKETAVNADIDSQFFKKLIFSFSCIALAFGAFKISSKYFITLVLKDELGSYDAIRDVMAGYYFVGSCIIILVSIFMGNMVRRYRLSPISLMKCHIVLMLIFTMGAVVYAELWPRGLGTGVPLAFLALAVARRVSESCFNSPANQMIITSFVDKARLKLRSVYNIYYYPLVGFPLAILFTFITSELELYDRPFVLGLSLVFLVIGGVAIFQFRPRLVDVLYNFIRASSKASAVAAVRALSYLRPQDYTLEMSSLLKSAPKKVLRKTIILGLGHVRKNADAMDAVLQEFNSDQEEIQVAVLDALQVSSDYRAVQFLANIMMAREQSHSLRVRMNAASMIAALYGRKAIPFLLNGLEDEDERVVANTLEVLAVFRDKTLISYFGRFIDSPVPRVRANALMGLARFRSEREMYNGIVKEILDGFDTHMLVSILYVVGKTKDESFERHLTRLHKSSLAEDPMVRRGLAWCFTRLDDKRGLELFAEFFAEDYNEGDPTPYMHFFSQLSRDLRLDLVKYFAVNFFEQKELTDFFQRKLKNSHYDFHDEIDYLEILVETLEFNKQKKVA